MKTSKMFLVNSSPSLSVVVMRDVDEKSKGFGFVHFKYVDDVVNVVDSLNGFFKNDYKEWYVVRA